VHLSSAFILIFQDLTPESIPEEIWYGSWGLHLFAAPICVFKKDMKGLAHSHSVLDQSRVALNQPVLSREEHLATSPRQEDPIYQDKARLSSTQGLLTRFGTMGTTSPRIGGKE
jgi:hypothetical protein